MEKKIFTESFKIRYSETDYNLVLKPSVLLNFLQDTASDNAEELNFGYTYITKKNLAWFLLKYRMEFKNYPSNISNLTITTEPRGYNKLFAYRDFNLYSDKELLGRISSTWSLVDIDKKTLTPISASLENNIYMQPYKKREDDLLYSKIQPIKNIDVESIYDIRFDDIDVNCHANNANYITWAFETLDFDFRSKNKLKTLDIVFKKEIKYGNKIISQTEIDKNTSNHVLKNAETGEELCLIYAEWSNEAQKII